MRILPLVILANPQHQKGTLRYSSKTRNRVRRGRWQLLADREKTVLLVFFHEFRKIIPPILRGHVYLTAISLTELDAAAK